MGGEGARSHSIGSFRMMNPPAWCSTAVAIAGFVAVCLYYFRFRMHPDGMTLYPNGASCLMRGEPLIACAPGFTYPPFFAFVMIPFTFLPLWGRILVWYVVSLMAAYGSYKVCEVLTAKAFHMTAGELPWLRLFSLALTIKLILSVFENQAYDGLVFFLVLVGLYGVANEKTILASVGFATATALKATPILFFVYLLFLRKWKILVLSIALFMMASLLPDVLFPSKDPQTSHFHRWIAEVGGGGLFGSRLELYPPFWQGANHLNQSLRSFVFRIVDGREGADFSTDSRTFLYIVYVIYVVAAGSIVIRSAKLEASYVWGGSVVLISMLLLSPMSSKSHFVVLLLPYMTVVACLIKNKSMWKSALPLLAGSFLLNTLTAKTLIGRELSNRLLAMGCVTLGTLSLLAVIGLLVFRSRAPAKSMGQGH